MRVCPVCKQEFQGPERFCPFDGAKLQEKEEKPADPLLGTTVHERYHIVSRLGRGPSGTVYLAEHVLLGTRYALKLLEPNLTKSEDRVAAYRRHAAKAAGLDSTHVVRLHDFGTVEDGLCYVVTDLVDGRTLGDTLRQAGPMPPERAVAVALQIAACLDATHDAGILHGALKPSNVFLVDADRVERVRLSDFGIYRLYPPGSLVEAAAAGVVWGAPEYQPPEQIRGERLDPRADVYTLGVLLYEMLTGRPPFVGETALETQKMVLHEKPLPMNLAKGVDVPADLGAAVMQALSKNPGSRFATMGIFGRVLGSIQEASVTTRTGGDYPDDAATILQMPSLVSSGMLEPTPSPMSSPKTMIYGSRTPSPVPPDLDAGWGDIPVGPAPTVPSGKGLEAIKATVDMAAKREAEEQAKREAEEQAKREAEERAKREAEERAKREAEERAKREAEERAKREAEERAKREAEERARREAEERAKREAEERAKREAEEQAKREAEEQAKREAEERAKREAEEQAKREAEEQAKREAEDKEPKRKKRSKKRSRRKKKAEEQRAARELTEKEAKEPEPGPILFDLSDNEPGAGGEGAAVEESRPKPRPVPDMFTFDEPEEPVAQPAQVVPGLETSEHEAWFVERAEELDAEKYREQLQAEREKSNLSVYIASAIVISIMAIFVYSMHKAAQEGDLVDAGVERGATSAAPARSKAPVGSAIAPKPERAAPAPHQASRDAGTNEVVSPSFQKGQEQATTHPTGGVDIAEPDEPSPDTRAASGPGEAASSDRKVADEPSTRPGEPRSGPGTPHVASTPVETEPKPVPTAPKPVVAKPAPKPAPRPVAVEHRPKPKPKPEPRPKPEPKPKPKPEPKPVAAKPEPAGERPKPKPAKAEGKQAGNQAPDMTSEQKRKESRRQVKIGLNYLRAARYEDARRAFTRALELDPRSAAAANGLGQVAFQQGRFHEAVKYAQLGVRLSPNNDAYHALVGNSYFKLRQYRKAIASWKRALQLNPSNDRARHYIKIAQKKLEAGK